MAENLWGGFPTKAEAEPPLKILRYQAALIETETDNRLSGRIVQSHLGDRFNSRFLVVAPYLDDYELELLSVSNTVQMYPLTLSESVGNMKSVECADEKEFVEALRTLLQSPQIRSLVGALLAQSAAAIDPTLPPDVDAP